jgi:hypothetical protein
MIGIWDTSLWDGATWGADPYIYVDDTHDGDFRARKMREEREAVDQRRQRVLALYERIVEGKQSLPDAAEYIVTRAVEAAGIEARADILKAPTIDLGRILAGLERASAIQRDMQLEADDEEVMLLL